MVYKQMSCFDELIESIEYPTILIIYDDQYQIAKKYENDTIKCIPKQEIYHFEQSYQYVILCCEDDYYNLLMNYRIHRDMLDVQVYSLIGKKAIVTESIDCTTGKGQIKFEGEVWSAKSKEQINIPAGSEVEIVSIEGVKAFVKPLKINSNVEA